MIQRYETRVEDEAGASYEVAVYGAARETSQPNREALAYWASGPSPARRMFFRT